MDLSRSYPDYCPALTILEGFDLDEHGSFVALNAQMVVALLVVVAASTSVSHLRRPTARCDLDLKVPIGRRKAWYAANRTHSP